MKFCNIYDQIIHHWPEEIVIDDGHPAGRDDTGYNFPSLNQAHHAVEEQIGQNDPWLQMMVWTMFQEFHDKAWNEVEAGKQRLKTRKVSKSAMERRYFENLHSDEWRDLLPSYEREIR